MSPPSDGPDAYSLKQQAMTDREKLVKLCIATADEEIGDTCRVQAALKSGVVDDYYKILSCGGLVGPHSFFAHSRMKAFSPEVSESLTKPMTEKLIMEMHSFCDGEDTVAAADLFNEEGKKALRALARNFYNSYYTVEAKGLEAAISKKPNMPNDPPKNPMTGAAAHVTTVPVSDEMIVANCYEAFKFQNGGVAMCNELKPSSDLVRTIVSGLREDPLRWCSLTELAPDQFTDGAKSQRWEMLSTFESILRAAMVAMSTRMGVGHLIRVSACSHFDRLPILDSADQPVDVGARVTEVQSLMAKVRGTIEGTASPHQTRLFMIKMWAMLGAPIELEQISLTGSIRSLFRSGALYELPPDAKSPAAPKSRAKSQYKFEPVVKRITLGDSDDERPARSASRPKVSEEKYRIPKKKPESTSRSSRSSRSSSSTTPKGRSRSPSPASDTSWDSDFGGSRYSKYACYSMANYKKCDKDECTYSHRPRILRAYRNRKSEDKSSEKRASRHDD